MNCDSRVLIATQNNISVYVELLNSIDADIVAVDQFGNESRKKFEESFKYRFGNHKFGMKYEDFCNLVLKNNQSLSVQEICKRADKCNKKILGYSGKNPKQEQIWLVQCNDCGHIAEKYARFFNQCSGCNNLNKVTDNEIFKKTASIKHNNRYIYSDDYVNSYTKMKMICKKCSYTFYQRPYNHLKGNGCPKCKISSGELAIERWLIDHNEEHIWQHKFDDLKNIKHLKLDFYSASKNTIIEYDGEGHSELDFYIRKGSKNPQKDLENAQYNDSLKNKYAEQNGIKMLRISFKDKKNISKILNNHFYGDLNA